MPTAESPVTGQTLAVKRLESCLLVAAGGMPRRNNRASTQQSRESPCRGEEFGVAADGNHLACFAIAIQHAKCHLGEAERFTVP